MQARKLISELAKSKVAAKRLAKSVSATELKRAVQNLQSAITALEKLEAEQAIKARAANLKTLKLTMDKLGLSQEDVLSLVRKKGTAGQGITKKPTTKKKAGPLKGRKIAPKYSIKVGKETHKWSGRGRMPLVFKDFLQKGGSLEECLIK